MQKSPKSAFLAHLEKRINTEPPKEIDAYIIDASFFVHLFSNTTLPVYFGEIARILKKILECPGEIIHFVVDKWIKPSIKDIEREKRNASEFEYRITGPTQKRPSN